jgi:hypothetical protein
MSDELSIYFIILLNTSVQLMLIRSLKFPAGGKRKYYLLAVGIPVLVMLSMRLIVAGGLIQGRVADQSRIEQYITAGASILIMAGPWIVTLAAIFDKKRVGLLNKIRAELERTE